MPYAGKIRALRLSSWLPALIVAALLCGCRKSAQAPAPPITRSDFVLELYASLEARDHDLSLKKIEKLRVLDPSNVFLANMHALERDNVIVRSMQENLNSGDAAGSLSEGESALAKYGLGDRIGSACDELRTLSEIRSILDAMDNPDSDSIDVARAGAKLKDISGTYKPALIFANLAVSQIGRAREMRRWEMKRAIEDMNSDYLHLRDANPSLAAVILASLLKHAENSDDLSQSDLERITTKDQK